MALIVVNEIIFLKCALKPSTQTTIFPHVNGLLLRGFRQITHFTYAYNIIISYLNTFVIPNVSHYRFSEVIFKESDSSIIHWLIYGKKGAKQNNFVAKEKPLSAEQNGKIHFCVGYFVYEIRGIKRMRVQKPL